MFGYIVKKEFLLILRDIHALLVLFIMPLLFIVIMSLALQNSFDAKIDVKYKVAVVGGGDFAAHKQLIESIGENNIFQLQMHQGDRVDLLYGGGYDLVLVMPKDFKRLIQNSPQDLSVELFSKAEVSQQFIESFKALITAHTTKIMMQDLLHSLGVQSSESDMGEQISHKYIQSDGSVQKQPTSVQYSVPAWLVFSLFFILIPISNTFINEKKHGTIDRIQSIGISPLPIIFAKFLPYFVINQVQVVLMLGVGFFLIPLFGGDALVIEGSIWGVFVVSIFVSFAAISFGILIANIAKTSEEATTIGGVSNIILAAIGGIMVPKVVMPQAMQEFSNLSPMSWALEGFLEFILRGGSLSSIADNLVYLMLFGIICLSFSYRVLKKGIDGR